MQVQMEKKVSKIIKLFYAIDRLLLEIGKKIL